MLPKILEGEDAKLVIKTKEGKPCPYLFAETALAKRLSGLSQIMHDLDHAKELISLIETVESNEIRYSLWMSAVVTYGKCFASASGRKNKLEIEHVKRFNSEALEYHNAIISQRNQYFAHAGQNEYEKSGVGIILAPEEDGRKVLWANHLIVKKSGISSEEIKLFCALCNGLLNVVEPIAEEVHKLVLNEFKEMSLDDLYKKAQERT